MTDQSERGTDVSRRGTGVGGAVVNKGSVRWVTERQAAPVAVLHTGMAWRGVLRAGVCFLLARAGLRTHLAGGARAAKPLLVLVLELVLALALELVEAEVELAREEDDTGVLLVEELGGGDGRDDAEVGGVDGGGVREAELGAEDVREDVHVGGGERGGDLALGRELGLDETDVALDLCEGELGRGGLGWLVRGRLHGEEEGRVRMRRGGGRGDGGHDGLYARK